jgi:hypothetical protein
MRGSRVFAARPPSLHDERAARSRVLFSLVVDRACVVRGTRTDDQRQLNLDWVRIECGGLKSHDFGLLRA